jgi:addiction module HigA family antidote
MPGRNKWKLLTTTESKEDTMPRIPTHRAPTHPGEMLLEEFLNPMGVSQRQLADALHVPYQRINELINGRRGMTPSTALRLAKFFGMSADFWMNLQLRWDLYQARQAEAQELKSIRPRTNRRVA